jgi:hypothetical protein
MAEEKETLPEANEVTVKLKLNDAKECLKYLPSNLERVRSEIEKSIEHANFWNFLRYCEYLEYATADFHFMGLMTPAWHLYCKHPENKEGTERLHIEGLPKKVKDKITGACNIENCPLYRTGST